MVIFSHCYEQTSFVFEVYIRRFLLLGKLSLSHLRPYIFSKIKQKFFFRHDGRDLLKRREIVNVRFKIRVGSSSVRCLCRPVAASTSRTAIWRRNQQISAYTVDIVRLFIMIIGICFLSYSHLEQQITRIIKQTLT